MPPVELFMSLYNSLNALSNICQVLEFVIFGSALKSLCSVFLIVTWLHANEGQFCLFIKTDQLWICCYCDKVSGWRLLKFLWPMDFLKQILLSIDCRLLVWSLNPYGWNTISIIPVKNCRIIYIYRERESERWSGVFLHLISLCMLC